MAFVCRVDGELSEVEEPVDVSPQDEGRRRSAVLSDGRRSCTGDRPRASRAVQGPVKAQIELRARRAACRRNAGLAEHGRGPAPVLCPPAEPA